MRVSLALFTLLVSSCAATEGIGADAMTPFDGGTMAPFDGGARADAPSDAGQDAAQDSGGAFVCPPDGVLGRGTHRLFVQGHDARPREDGTWPFLHERRSESDALLCDDREFVTDTDGDGRWEPGEEPLPLGPAALVHGEHFLVGPGAFVELTVMLCDDITGNVALYIPNFDEEGSRALHELFVVRDGVETLVAEAVDEEPGFSGYSPFVRVLAGEDPDARAGDTLLLRSTNLSGRAFSVMVWRPPSEYESWILVEVP